MKFSVIVTSYNNAPALKHALKSIGRQESGDFEVIVADDGSSDGSKDAAMDFARSRDCNYPLKFVSQADKGWRLSEVRNLGATLAAGEFLVFVDGDQLCDGKLLSEYSRMAVGPCGAAGVRHYIRNSPQEKTDHILRQPRIDFFDRRIAQKKIRAGEIGFMQAWGCNCMVKREIWDEVGGFDESFPGWGAEDTDFFSRVERAGYPILGCPEAVVYHFPEPPRKPVQLGRRYWREKKKNDGSINRNNGRHVKVVQSQEEPSWIHVEM